MGEWRAVVGYEGRYEVSSSGEVRSLPRFRVPQLRYLRPHLGKNGYLTVGLSMPGQRTKTTTVHSLVARAFLGPLPEGLEVRHLNGNPPDCHLSNLSHGTRSQNNRDQIDHGTHPSSSKTHCPQNHPYSDDNLYRIASRPTWRYCRACIKIRNEEKQRVGKEPQPERSDLA